MQTALTGAVVTALIVFASSIAYPWGSKGHRIINLKAVMQLPNTMSTLKSDSLFYEAHASDADNRKNSIDTSFFAEAQRHFIDIDSYPNFLNLPHNRDSVVAINGWSTVRTNGTLPWAIQMVLDSLTAQLHRGDANTARYTMSDLGHYVADAHQPLHCTANYDGWSTNNGGIHSRYESGMINSYGDLIVVSVDSIHYVASPLEFAFGIIYHSNALVDSVLQADTYAKSVSGWNGSGSPPSTYYEQLWQKAHRFTEDQFQRATVALASLWYTAWVNAGISTSVDEFADAFSEGFRLEQNYPNPFNPKTDIGYRVSGIGFVSLNVYDMLGRRVSTLVNEVKQPGTYTVQFDASHLASGVYLYRLVSGNFMQTKKLLLVR